VRRALKADGKMADVKTPHTSWQGYHGLESIFSSPTYLARRVTYPEGLLGTADVRQRKRVKPEILSARWLPGLLAPQYNGDHN
jgi:hypothetical protein